MEKNIITLIDDNGIEMLATYRIEHTPSQIEEGHGYHDIGNTDGIELLSIEVVIAKVAFDILHLLNDKQVNKIIKHIEDEV
jgi:hypothetical protein